MSTPVTEVPPGTIACPRCGAAVGPDQDWCLECGAAARTQLAPTPNWRLPILLVSVVVVLALAGLAAAFVVLTDEDQPAQPAVATAPPASAPAPPAP